MEGTVEVFLNRTWGTVCDHGWDMNDATVVCRMLGYGRALGAPGTAYFGEGSGEILFDDVICSGTEENLARCRFSDAPNNCGHSDDASVICGQEDFTGILTCFVIFFFFIEHSFEFNSIQYISKENMYRVMHKMHKNYPIGFLSSQRQVEGD